MKKVQLLEKFAADNRKKEGQKAWPSQRNLRGP